MYYLNTKIDIRPINKNKLLLSLLRSRSLAIGLILLVSIVLASSCGDQFVRLSLRPLLLLLGLGVSNICAHTERLGE